MRNVLTVDVEEYFHVSAFEGVIGQDDWPACESRFEAGVDRLLELFAARGIRATFFVLGWVAAHRPGPVRRIADAGHEIACHSYAHRLIFNQTRAEFAQDVARAKRAIEDVTGRPVQGYRAPSFSIVEQTLWALDVLLEQGFEYDSSIFPIRHDRYGIPSAPRGPHRLLTPGGAVIWELPPATVRYLGATLPVAGGGYLRHLPPGVMHWGIRRLNDAEGLPAVVYVHPWELDPEQPRQPVGRLTAWRHYGNLERTEERLVSLLDAFAFGAADTLIAEWAQRPVRASRARQAPARGAGRAA
jgi:polysaccharide deacetylase family protein (PEP-CTERM system associated)